MPQCCKNHEKHSSSSPDCELVISSREGSLSSDHLPLLPHHSTKVGSYDDQGLDDDDDGDDGGGGVNDDEAKALKIGKRKGKRLK